MFSANRSQSKRHACRSRASMPPHRGLSIKCDESVMKPTSLSSPSYVAVMQLLRLLHTLNLVGPDGEVGQRRGDIGSEVVAADGEDQLAEVFVAEVVEADQRPVV